MNVKNYVLDRRVLLLLLFPYYLIIIITLPAKQCVCTYHLAMRIASTYKSTVRATYDGTSFLILSIYISHLSCLSRFISHLSDRTSTSYVTKDMFAHASYTCISNICVYTQSALCNVYENDISTKIMYTILNLPCIFLYRC